MLAWRLDALGDQVELEAAGEGDEQLEHGGVAGRGVVGGGGADEGPIDLDHVDGELVEPGEGGVAGAEVVDRDPNPGCAQVRENLDDIALLDHDGALGDLQHQAAGGQPGQAQDGEDLSGVAILAQLSRTDVDRDLGGRGVAELGAPFDDLPAWPARARSGPAG